jgi:hypothetical protein
MSKLSYQLSIKKYQRELGLDDRTFNALDFKHNDINLLKQLQILNPVIAVPASAPANTGWYGTFVIANITGPGSLAKYIQVKLAYNNVDITSYITIAGGTTETITVPIGSRLPNPGSTLQEIVLFETGITNANGVEDIVNFTVTGFTGSLETGVITDILVDAGSIDGGELIQDVTIDTEN